MEAEAYVISKSQIGGNGSYLSPMKYSRSRLDEQIIFTKKKCLKPSIVKKDLGLADLDPF